MRSRDTFLNSICFASGTLFLLLLALLPAGYLQAQSPYNALGDTLTVIQIPILNVPAIQIPGETMQITCIAPTNTTGWAAYLKHGAKTIPMAITSSEAVTNPSRWILNAVIPQVPVFELYDLRVTASGGIDDTTQNAVQVLPTRKTNYYFAHVTDLHMPTNIYYPDAGYNSDSTSVNDFRSVVDDLNLIRPEFVLITGDVVNEGELENFNGMFVYGWAQRVMAELEVPFFLTVGNHDVGGWDATPPSQGSSRRNWWRYFGWPWLNHTDNSSVPFTQDYSFDYGDLHYIGLESYDNYDSWRYNIYGNDSFTAGQMAWLNSEVALHPNQTKVLFHHYDFNSQLNLSALDIDLSLWGHIHRNSGSISTFPYDLATRSTCSGNRAYRIIKVEGTQITPYNSIYAGSSGTNLNVSFIPANNAIADSVMAIVSNNQPLPFNNALVKFRMPSGNATYTVTNGVLEQVDRSGAYNVCYVRTELAANNTRYVSIKESGTPNDDLVITPSSSLLNVYPNPFLGSLCLDPYDREIIEVRIYNIRGELIRNFKTSEGMIWDTRDNKGNSCPAGVYILRARSGEVTQTIKLLKRE